MDVIKSTGAGLAVVVDDLSPRCRLLPPLCLWCRGFFSGVAGGPSFSLGGFSFPPASDFLPCSRELSCFLRPSPSSLCRDPLCRETRPLPCLWPPPPPPPPPWPLRASERVKKIAVRRTKTTITLIELAIVKSTSRQPLDVWSEDRVQVVMSIRKLQMRSQVQISVNKQYLNSSLGIFISYSLPLQF